MPDIVRLYFDLFDNIFTCLLIYAVAKNHTDIVLSIKRSTVIILINVLYSIPESIPYNEFFTYLFPYCIIFAICYPHWKNTFVIYIKHFLIQTIGLLIISLFHFLILDDNAIYKENFYYHKSKGVICLALVYIFYVLYIHGKRMKHINRFYQYLFSGIILCISLALSYLTLYICQTTEFDAPTIPILMSALFLLIIACLEIYKRFINILEENMQMQIQLEKTKLTAEYSDTIDKRLKELHSLRHDMRNHFLTIDGYASMKRSESIHQYISQISEKL